VFDPVILERVTRVAAGRIELYRRVAVMSSEPGFVERHRFGFAARPVVAIAADRNDQFAGRDFGPRIGKAGGKPGVRSDRPGFAALPVLVIIHHEDGVGGRGEAGQIPVRIGGWCGQPDPKPGFGEVVMIAGEHR